MPHRSPATLKSAPALAVLALILTACGTPTEPAPAAVAEATVEVAVPTVGATTAPAAEADMIQPQDVTIDTQGLPYSWQANLVPATPYDASQPPGPKGLPEHIEINFGVSDPGLVQPNDPIMYIIPIDAYEALWNDAGNPMVTAMISEIYTNTVALPAPPPTSGMPALPPETVGGGVNDMATQIGQIEPDPESASKTGFRFVGRWAQDANPVTNVGLRYVYQGFTNDGAYLVAFFYPVATAKLPADAAAVPAADMEAFNADPQAAIQAQAELLNALPTSDWSPDLATLDSLVASLRIEGMGSGEEATP